jgi:RNA polymerase sigma factor (sigma-70 family)
MGRWAPPETIACALSGSEGDAEQLIAAIWPACFRLALMITGDRGLAEDAAQEACVIVHRKIRSLRAPEAFDAWLYRIVLRESARVRRCRGRIAQPAENFIEESDNGLTLDVWRALAALSNELREVTVLFYFRGLSCDEIADVMGASSGAVRARLSRARERLRSSLADYDFRFDDNARTGVQVYAV